ncbi:MAG: biopolymer transporter ExbD [Planctomycetaceae bacterium]|jgi:biopolymer transport protein ExbD|nr:biopolymer transporter ExbD [Planctomycetaceae bacterium]
MRSPNHLQPKGITLNLTPMIDVVFLLIIFFLVSSNLIQQDILMDVDIPAASNVDRIIDSVTKKITINIPASGSIYVGATPTDMKQLKSILIKHRNVWGKDAELRIRTNKNVPYGEIEFLLLLAAEVGIWDVSFVVLQK